MLGSDGAGDDVFECEAVVKWFNSAKGFGFVQPGDGSSDAFLHISVLNKIGVSEVVEGQSLVCKIGEGRKGPDVKEIVELGSAPASAPKRSSGGAPRPPQGDSWEARGQVKFFNQAKGFGMVTLENGKDAFIGDRLLKPMGIEALETREDVEVMVAEGPRGLMVVELLSVGSE